MLSQISDILEKMQPITLDEMKKIRLMDRIDSKFVAPVALLPLLLDEMQPYFRVQINDANQKIAPYSTQYLDTPGLEMFVMHQNGKLNRQKIRIRSYTDSDISFLEVKNKNNKGRTKKVRVPVGLTHVDSVDDLLDNADFLDENSIFDRVSLNPSLSNVFNRITFVNNKKTERITIDFNLFFYNYKTKEDISLNDIMILELKQDGWQHSDFRDILLKLRVKKCSFSKYCMGLLYTDPGIKYNRFKRRPAKFDKIVNRYNNDSNRL